MSATTNQPGVRKKRGGLFGTQPPDEGGAMLGTGNARLDGGLTSAVAPPIPSLSGPLPNTPPQGPVTSATPLGTARGVRQRPAPAAGKGGPQPAGKGARGIQQLQNPFASTPQLDNILSKLGGGF